MEWFRHDVNAHDDIKIKKLLKKHGFSALGVYWFIVEILFTNDGRLEYADAVDEVCLVDGLTEEDAKVFVDLLLDLKLLYTDGSSLGSHRVDAELSLNEELRQKKIDAGRKGGIAKANNAKAMSSTATSKPSTATSKASTLQDNTIQDKKNIVLSFTNVTDNTHSTPAGAEPPKPSKKQIDVNKIAELFNDICSSYPKATKLSDKRKQAIRARINSGYTLEDFKVLFLKAESSDFLKGANDRNWSATFDWLIADRNMAKVLDGNYDNNTKKNRGTGKAFRPTDLNGQYDNLPPVEVIHV